MIKLLRFDDPDFAEAFAHIENRAEEIPADIDTTVRAIIDDVQQRGDAALQEYTLRFDRLDLNVQGMEVSAEEIATAVAQVSADDLAALKLAAERIGTYHRRQKQETWLSTDESDILLGQMIRPLDRVG
ncbi:MAG: histidinol dehydrogenase, partial [Desulfuromonas sp.]